MAAGIALIQTYFKDLKEDQCALLEQYVDELLRWNKSINLISRKNEEEVWVNHILHALSISKVVSFLPGQKVLDFGTGGGLPGIPLAILNPEVHFLLVDSIGKKVSAVQAMVEEMGLKNVRVLHERVENVSETFDFAVSRAVTRFENLDPWLRGKIDPGKIASIPNGLLYIKGGDFEDELAAIKRPYRMWECSDWFTEEFFETKKVVWLAPSS